MLHTTLSEITHTADGVISIPVSKPLITVAFDRLSLSAQGLPSGEFTCGFAPPPLADVCRVNSESEDAMLCVKLPKRGEAKLKQIEVKRSLV
jgi:hypothetical protein